ncbi:membrane protein [Labrys miyagiensis]
MMTFRLFLREFWLFGLKQASACLFGGAFLALILATRFCYPPGFWMSRYDFLVLAALGIQGLLLALRLETWDEAAVIAIFHVVGTIMEIYKTSVGSWAYPEASLLKIGMVPLFSGFMYSAVGSYIARAARLFDFHYSAYPRMRWTMLLAALIYANFFTHHVLPDIRLALFAGIGWLFRHTDIYFTVDRERRSMPLLLGFFLVALFIWIAENVGTYSQVWIYPHQHHGFALVSLGKLGAWYLLMIVSFVMVSLVHRPMLLRRPARKAIAG